jgi:hypothetical protein
LPCLNLGKQRGRATTNSSIPTAAEVMAKIAKESQTKAFDNIKISLNAVLDHAKTS